MNERHEAIADQRPTTRRFGARRIARGAALSIRISSARCVGIAASLLGIAFTMGSVQAQDRVPDKMTMVVGYDAGGGYDIYARFVARFMPNHLPGSPRIIVQNMPGASSLTAANHLYNVAARDGSVLGVVGQSIGLNQMLGQSGIKFDAARFSWIGRITDVNDLIGVWHTAPVKTIAETHKTEVGIAIGAALSGSTLYVRFLNALTGTRLKPIAGYSSIESLLAVERGEIDGTASISKAFLNASRPDWISSGKLRILVQAGLTPDPGMPGVPLMIDLARNEEDRTVLRTVATIEGVGFSVTAPPALPPAVLETLRAGFMAAMTDPAVVAQAAKERVELGPLSGAGLQSLMAEFFRVPPHIVAKVREIAVAEGARK